MEKAILHFICPDQPGLVSIISSFIFERKGNILSLNEYVDTDTRTFFLRVAWDMQGFELDEQKFREEFGKFGERFSGSWEIYYSSRRLRVAIFVSKYDHCLRDLLWRYNMQEFPIEVPLIISNHSDLKHIGERYDIPFYVFPLTKEDKRKREEEELSLLKEQNVDTIVLARYMQILSPEFVKHYPNRIINIHHSFLPAFIGGNPYRQAYDRGVKIIGATSHFVTEALDEGPIIEQDISRITHRDEVKDLIRKGRDLERLVLARALKLYSEQRVLVHGRKTVIFE
jgi:formyltetrahydrofolate deformylase